MRPAAEVTPAKLRGAYYTPPDLADYLARWVAARDPRVVLEPSCGDGVFVAALARRAPRARVVALERDPAEAAKARDRVGPAGGDVIAADFLAWALTDGPPVDGVVGNPPYVRYQFLDDAQQALAERVIRREGLPFTRHTNAWVPFVIGALARLRPGGRLAMVVPAELLHVLHAASVRAYLLRVCAHVAVIDPEELWFDGATQGAVILLAERGPGPATLQITPVRGRAFLDEAPPFGAGVAGATVPGKWTWALLSDAERGAMDAAAAVLPRFDEVATVAVGIVTGANEFFLVNDATVAANDLGAYARPMFGRSEHVPGVIYDAATHADNARRGLPTHFLALADPLGPGAAAYVAAGERDGLHERYKCRIRTPWYRVPSVWTAPVALLKRCHDHPKLVRNTLGAFTTDTAYRIVPRVDADALVAGFVTSATALAAELEGRHYGGGVLELVPSEIARLRVAVAPGRLEALDQACRAGTPAADLLATQDAAVLPLPAADRAALHAAWWRLRRRRHRAPPDDV